MSNMKRKAWNKNKTFEDTYSPEKVKRLKSGCALGALKLKGRTYEDIHGVKKAKELKKIRSLAKKGTKLSKATREKKSISMTSFYKKNPAFKNFLSDLHKGKTYEEIHGEKKGKELREKKKGSRVERFGQTKADLIAKAIESGRKVWFDNLSEEEFKRIYAGGFESTKYGRRKDLNNQFFRSTWEANYARILNYLNIDWQFEPKRFKLLMNEKICYYLPDFYLPKYKTFVEVKGGGSADKFYAFREQYFVKTFLVHATRYYRLVKIFKDKISYWE